MQPFRRRLIFTAPLLGLGTPAVFAQRNPRSSPDTAAESLQERMRFGWLGRSDVQEFISEISDRHSIPRTWLERQFRGLGTQPRALSLVNPPPPSPGETPPRRSWSRYLAQHVDTRQVIEGYAFMTRHRETLAAVASASGVPVNIMCAIIGVETRYGKFTGSFPTLETLATLAFHSPRRGDFFRQELEALLLMGHQGVVPVRDVKGSFAGALGLPQFMPSSWMNFAVSFRGRPTADLINDPQDAIASVGQFLRHHGWRRDEPSHARVTLPEGLDASGYVAPKLEPIHTVATIEAAGVVQIGRRLPSHLRASLIDLPEAEGRGEYWIAAHNFFVITQYNRSFMYAAAVLSLAESLEGGGA
jgi:membrane-bound lytic murein transglycosylase B